MPAILLKDDNWRRKEEKENAERERFEKFHYDKLRNLSPGELACHIKIFGGAIPLIKFAKCGKCKSNLKKGTLIRYGYDGSFFNTICRYCGNITHHDIETLQTIFDKLVAEKMELKPREG